MRFRTEVVPVVLVVSASAFTMPLVTSCKKQETALDASINGPIIIKRREDIPPVMGGIAVPYTPPAPSASGAQQAPAPAQTAPMGKAPSGAAAAAPAVEAAPQASALAIQHNHPPDQPCNHPLKKEEVEKALSDLQSKPK
jgi:hypothetical protein